MNRNIKRVLLIEIEKKKEVTNRPAAIPFI